jgi:pyruvate ferredoxin oxidoreductase beta subunit
VKQEDIPPKSMKILGNRLNPSLATIQAQQDRPNSLTAGHRACQGCGEALGARYVVDAALRATEGQLIVINGTGCLEVFSSLYPESAWQVAWMHSLFGNTPSVATGVAAAMRIRGKTARVLAQGGDGSTTDISFGCLSGLFERGDDVLYVCYDNEAYMNTGVQRSSATPPAARTATTPSVGPKPGNVFGTGKNVPKLALAHGISYVATASIAFLQDLEKKVFRAMTFQGARYLHVHVPCPLGWGTAPRDTLVHARAAVHCGLFPLFEGESGHVTRSFKIKEPLPVETYLRGQRRFAHLFGKAGPDTERLQALQSIAEAHIREFDLV